MVALINDLIIFCNQNAAIKSPAQKGIKKMCRYVCIMMKLRLAELRKYGNADHRIFLFDDCRFLLWLLRAGAKQRGCKNDANEGFQRKNFMN